MKHFSILGPCLLLAISASPAYLAQTAIADDGSLSAEAMAKLHDSFHMDDHTRAMSNAITNNDLNLIALNRDEIREHTDMFNHKIKTGTVTNQNASGRCWLFAGLNMLRPQIVEKHKIEGFAYSQNYLAFWDKLEKANCFLEDVIELADRDPSDREVHTVFANAMDDGGWWGYVVVLIKKYGVVPSAVMPETHGSANTAVMNSVIRGMLKAEGIKLRKLKREGKSLEELRCEKAKIIADVYRILVMNLGEPPKKFRWQFEDKESKVSELRTYTPQSFCKEWLGPIDLDEYVQLGNDPVDDFGKLYRLDHSRNIEGTPDLEYLNVHIETLKRLALKSVLDKQPVWFAADVAKDQDRVHGIMETGIYDYADMFDIKSKLTKADRLAYDEGGPTHAMVLMGVDLEESKPVKWLVENSWGKERGHDGYWTLYDNWFNEHLYMVVIKKKYIPEPLLARFDQKPIELPRWHPMSQASD